MSLFVVFEGIEGCGKSTQVELLNRYLSGKKLPVVTTREPGGTPVGEHVRALFLNSANHGITPLTELLLVTAARVQHVQEVIRPALDGGSIVLCDRFCDATAAYQGHAGGVSMETIDRCHELFLNGLLPDVTVLFDCPVAVGLQRSRSRNRAEQIEESEGRFEAKDIDYHERVRQGYLERARREPQRFVMLDGTLPVEALHRDVCRVLTPFLEDAGYAV